MVRDVAQGLGDTAFRDQDFNVVLMANGIGAIVDPDGDFTPDDFREAMEGINRVTHPTTPDQPGSELIGNFNAAAREILEGMGWQQVGDNVSHWRRIDPPPPAPPMPDPNMSTPSPRPLVPPPPLPLPPVPPQANDGRPMMR